MLAELKACIKEVSQPHSKKYFWHNLSCELRRGRYKSCYDYEDTWSNRFLFSLGVLIMDFWGTGYKKHTRFKSELDRFDMWLLEQWLSHPFPWIRFMCRKHIDKFAKKES